MSNKNKTEFLISLLKLKNQLKLYHWQTNLHSRHVASDKFLTKFSGVLDNIIEAYQGKYGVIYLKEKKSINIENVPDNKIIEFMEQMRKYLVDIAPKIFNKEENGDLFNLRDEILENIDIAIYLFNQK